MRTPTLAIAWQLWTRNRRGAISALIGLAALALGAPPFFAATGPVQAALAASVLPLIPLVGFFMNALLFTDQTGSLTSSYPRRMYALPVRTWTLATWPMIYGALFTSGLWVAIAALVYRPSGFATPIALPALGMAAAMAWLQALSWTPLASPWARVLISAFGIAGLAALPAVLRFGGYVSQGGLAACLGGELLAAWALALVALRFDRRGDTWRLWPEGLRLRLPSLRPQRQRPFRSAAEAQAWFEWSCFGRILPGLTAALALPVLGFATYILQYEPQKLPYMLACVAFLPVVMAGSVGANAGRMQPFHLGARGYLPFVAIRPMTSGGLARAKFQMAARSVLTTWAVMLGLVAFWLLASGRLGQIAEGWRAFQAVYPGGRGVAVAALGLGVLPVLTWKNLTDGLATGLSGDRWLAYTSDWINSLALVALVAGSLWFALHPDHLTTFVAVVPWVAAMGVVVKAAVAAWAFRAAVRRHLMRPGDAARIIAGWLALATAAVTLLVLVLPPAGAAIGGARISRPGALVGLFLVLPLARFPLAPLALSWGRHR